MNDNLTWLGGIIDGATGEKWDECPCPCKCRDVIATEFTDEDGIEIGGSGIPFIGIGAEREADKRFIIATCPTVSRALVDVAEAARRCVVYTDGNYASDFAVCIGCGRERICAVLEHLDSVLTEKRGGE